MPREISAAEERSLARYEAIGTPEEIAKQLDALKKENADRREKNKILETENAELKGKAPEGSKILTADEAKEWDDFKALGLKPKQVKEAVAERDTLKNDKAKRDKRDSLAKGAESEGWGEHAADLLMDLSGFDGVTVELKDLESEVMVNGRKETKTVKVPYFTEEGQAPQRATEWVKAKKPHLVDLLGAVNGKRQDGTGRPVPEQRGGGGKPENKTPEEAYAASTAKTADYDRF